jgi:hypothetical protein
MCALQEQQKMVKVGLEMMLAASDFEKSAESWDQYAGQ